jgi:hypothetical protein
MSMTTRIMLYSIVLLTLFGVDQTANRGSMTRDVTSVIVTAGKSTQNAMEATAGYMAGQR